MKSALLVAVAATTLVLSGCEGDSQGSESSAAPVASPEVSTVEAPEKGSFPAKASKTNLVLYVSNQSFDDERVHLSVTVNGEVVVDKDFDVEGQHSWVRYPLTVPAGVPLDLSAESDSGATLSRSVTAVNGLTRAVVINHWTNKSPTLEATITREPVAFD